MAGCAAWPGDTAAPSQRLADGVFAFPGAPGLPAVANRGRVGNAGLIVGRDGALLIDSGVSARHGQALLAAATALTPRPLRAAVLTHAHQEFLFGLAPLRERGVPVHMSAAAAQLMRSRCDNCLKNLRALLGDAEMAGTSLLAPDRLLPDNGPPAEPLPGLGRDVQLLRLGHAATPGDLAVWDAASGTLFAGGLVDARHIPDLADGRLPEWRAALARLAALPGLVRIVPGHGPVGGPALITEQLAYFSALEAHVTALINTGATLAEAGQRTELPAYRTWAGYDTLHRRNVSVLYLRLEEAQLFSRRGASGTFAFNQTERPPQAR